LADLGTYPEAEYYLSLLYLNKQGIIKGESVPNLECAKQFNKWLKQAALPGLMLRNCSIYLKTFNEINSGITSNENENCH
ncbi:44337_t:CDS:2, partial [Gigaspora margarita]